MDTIRRAAAIQTIGSFAENHQVLFFACHPEHAGELQNLAGSEKPATDEMNARALSSASISLFI